MNILKEIRGIFSFIFVNPECDCSYCYYSKERIRMKKANESAMRPLYIVCNKCGNKRCPKAAYHGNKCTNSNDPGQKGSDYE